MLVIPLLIHPIILYTFTTLFNLQSPEICTPKSLSSVVLASCQACAHDFLIQGLFLPRFIILHLEKNLTVVSTALTNFPAMSNHVLCQTPSVISTLLHAFVSSKKTYLHHKTLAMSPTNRINRTGHSKEPCGTQLETGFCSDEPHLQPHSVINSSANCISTEAPKS